MSSRYFHKVFVRLACLAALLIPAIAEAAVVRQVTLAWDASPDSRVVGYKIHYGTVPGQYASVVDVGLNTSATVTNLAAGTNFYFAVRAYSSPTLDSGSSNEIVYFTPAPIAPAAQITSPGLGSQINGPVNVNVAAQATDPDGLLTRVEIFCGAQMVGSSTAAPFTGICSSLPPGQYSLTAVAVDEAGGRWPSSPVNFQVVQLNVGEGRMRTDGVFEVTVSGAAGSSNRVWYSSDLTNWQLLTTTNNANGSVIVVDSSASTVSKRFYKVTSP